MATQTTPHTQTQQNADSAAADLEPGIDCTDVGQGDDAQLYENMDGAQTGGTRAFNANADEDTSLNTEGDAGETSGKTDLPQDGQIGITNYPTEERERQEKVING